MILWLFVIWFFFMGTLKSALMMTRFPFTSSVSKVNFLERDILTVPRQANTDPSVDENPFIAAEMVGGWCFLTPFALARPLLPCAVSHMAAVIGLGKGDLALRLVNGPVNLNLECVAGCRF